MRSTPVFLQSLLNGLGCLWVAAALAPGLVGCLDTSAPGELERTIKEQLDDAIAEAEANGASAAIIDPGANITVNGPAGLTDVTVIIPAGAISADIDDALLTIRAGGASNIKLDATYAGAGPVVLIDLYRISTGGAISLLRAATLSIPHTATSTTDLVVAHRTADGLETLTPTAVNTNPGTARVETRSFSPFQPVRVLPASTTGNADTTAPDTKIDSAPSGTVNSAGAVVTYSSPDADVSKFECRIKTPNKDAFADCPGQQSWQLSQLASGQVVVEVRAVDAAGNADPTPATASWTVQLDTTPPDTAFAPTFITGNTYTPGLYVDGTFSSGSADLAYFQCRIKDQTTYATCESNKWHPSLSGLSDGIVVFEVRAVDDTGNADATPATSYIVLDGTGTTAMIDSKPGNPSYSLDASFTFSVNEADEGDYFCSLDSNMAIHFTLCSSPKNYTNPGLGEHTFYVYGRDFLGNVGPTASYTWTIATHDVTGPVVTLDATPGDPSTDDEPSFAFSSVDSDVNYFECRVDAESFSSCVSPELVGPLAYGVHTFEVYAVDLVGNVGDVTTYTWEVTQAPATDPDWTRVVGGLGGDGYFGYGLDVDPSDTIYFGAQFTAPIMFAGDNTLDAWEPYASDSKTDIFIAGLDAGGTFMWAVSAGGADGQKLTDLAFVDGNAVVVGGTYDTEIIFAAGETNETIFTESLGNEFFLAKYTANGDFVWASEINRKIGGTTGSDLFVDGDDQSNYYAAGYQWIELEFGKGQPSAATTTHNGMFLARYGSDGSFHYVVTGSNIVPHAMKVAADGAVYVAGTFGSFSEDPVLGAGETTQTVLTSGSDYGMFVAKYSRAGVLQWARQATQPNESPQPTCLAVGSDGAVYGQGRLEGDPGDKLYFDAGGANSTALTPTLSSGSPYVFKFNADGTFAWADAPTASGLGAVIAQGCTIDHIDTLTVGGALVYASLDAGGGISIVEDGTGAAQASYNDIYMLQYNSSGTPTDGWEVADGGGVFATAGGVPVAVQSDGVPIIMGLFSESPVFPDGQLTPTEGASGFDYFVARTSSGD